jgi:hypothetical protein
VVSVVFKYQDQRLFSNIFIFTSQNNKTLVSVLSISRDPLSPNHVLPSLFHFHLWNSNKTRCMCYFEATFRWVKVKESISKEINFPFFFMCHANLLTPTPPLFHKCSNSSHACLIQPLNSRFRVLGTKVK